MAQDADLFWLDEMIPQAVSEVKDEYFAQQATALTRPFLRTLRVLRAAGLEPDSLSVKGPAASAIAATLPDILRDL